MAAPEFRFSDPRQERIYRRFLLIGPGPAAFFKDACVLMASDRPLATTPHIVAHLLREVESALRDVLLPYGFTRPSPCAHCGSRPGSHTAEIKAILAAYGLENTDEVADAWLRLSRWDEGSGLARLAHRNALGRPRPADEALHRAWEEIQALLDIVLEKFETRFLESFKVLDELLAKPSPSVADAKKLKNNVPNNHVTFGYFFDKLSNPAWLSLLRKEDFFKHPPEPERDEEEGTIGFPPWPESRYLARMAAVEGVQETVLEIALAVLETENVRVYEDLADVAFALPPHLAAQLASNAKTWLKSPHQILLPEKLGALVAHLAKGGEVDAALKLAKALLEVLPDDREPPSGEGAELRFPEARAHCNVSRYRLILERHVPALISIAGLEGLRLLSKLLDDGLRLSSRRGEKEKPDDYSAIWRPAIEDRSQRDAYGLKDVLVSAVRDAAEQIVREDPSRLPAVIEILEQHGWHVFERIALHLLLACPLGADELIRKRLTDKRFFDESERRQFRREYRWLAREHFGRLPREDQGTILDWIGAGPDLEEFRRRFEKWEARRAIPEEVDRYANQWRLDHLAPIATSLPEEWRRHYDALVAKLGQPDPSDLAVERGGIFKGPTSPKSAEELREMSVAEIVKYLKTWTAPGGFMSPSREGVGRALTAVVASDPDRFAREIESFRKLHPIYVRSLLEGFSQAPGNKRQLGWREILGLCRWVVEQPREFPGGGTEYAHHHEEDPDWGWTRKTIARLLESGFQRAEGAIPFELREQAWQVLQPLTEDPEPTPDYEAHYGGSNTDPPTLSINTVRGEAMHAVIQYALWVRRGLKAEPDGEERPARGFGEIQEACEVLDCHLDPAIDPSLAIRSVYGRYLPWLVFIDREWVVANLWRMLPLDSRLAVLRDAAWETYIVFCQPYDDTLRVLHEEYARAIERMGRKDSGARRTADPDERLAEHLMTFYWHGKLDLDDPAGLLGRFYARADESLRRRAVEFIGRSLRNTEGEVPEEIRERLVVLWSRRVDAAAASGAYEELVAFGWWFASQKLNESWATGQLVAMLRLTKRIDPDFLVLERLVELVPRKPQEVVECLRHMVEGSREVWELYAWREGMEKILRSILEGGDAMARAAAKDLINLLGARGHLGFRDLLEGESDSGGS